MAPSKLSQSPYLCIAANIFATIWVGFGIQLTLQPRKALDFFGFDLPYFHKDQNLVENLIKLYAIRDLFMGMAVYAAAYFGDRKTLGFLLLAGGLVAVMDGVVCKDQAGKGEWNHWGYAPIVTAVGSMLLGTFDRT